MQLLVVFLTMTYFNDLDEMIRVAVRLFVLQCSPDKQWKGHTIYPHTPNELFSSVFEDLFNFVNRDIKHFLLDKVAYLYR